MVTGPLERPKLGFLSRRIIGHLEAQSGVLADALWFRLKRCLRLRTFCERVPEEELRQRVYEIYRDLGDWLESKSELEIEHRYLAIGERRARQGVPLSQLVLGIVAAKEHLWEHISEELLTEDALQLVQILELSRCIEAFFDRAVFFAAIGHERHKSTV